MQCAALLGIGDRHFDATIRTHLPASAVRGSRTNLRFSAPAVVATWHAAKVEKLQERAKAADDDPLLASGDSPNLERYRLAKAQLAEMDLQERAKTHVRLSDLEPLLMQLGGNIRRAVEDVQRQYGNDAAARIGEALYETEQGWAKLVQSPESDSAANGKRGAGAGVGDEAAPRR